jgi:hypothetical protein
VLRTSPPVDSAGAAIEWSEAMDELATHRRKKGRFTRDQRSDRDVVEH